MSGMSEIDVLKLPDPKLKRYGNMYRILCRRQGNDVLMMGASPVTFAEFIFSQEAKQELDLVLYKLRQRRAARA